MNKSKRAVLGFILLMVFAVSVRAANPAIQEAYKDTNGVTLKTSGGAMRIEACGDRVIHVVASATAEIPGPKVPVASQPCQANGVTIKIGTAGVRLSTPEVTVNVNAATGAVSFLSPDGKTLLAEPKNGGRSFDVPSLAETKTWQIQQTFVSSAC